MFFTAVDLLVPSAGFGPKNDDYNPFLVSAYIFFIFANIFVSVLVARVVRLNGQI